MSRRVERSDPDYRPPAGRTVVRETGRWRGIVAVALFAAAVGTVVGRPSLVLAGTVGVAFAAYAKGDRAPDPDVSVERSLSTRSPGPGEPVRVTLEVTNEGGRTLPDLRVVDGVPPGLEVVDGSPRLATALRPGRSASLSYAVEATRGDHTFDPVTVLSRGYAGSHERERPVAAADELACAPRLPEGPPVPLQDQTTRLTGRVTTDVPGPGVEFHSVREYRPGDPLSRVAWHRVAGGEDLATVSFRQERAATVVLVVDAREAAYVAPPGGPAAAHRSVEAAAEAFTALLSSGDRVGLAAYGPREAWLPPGAGGRHRARARELLGTDPAFGPEPPEEPFLASIERRRLRRRLPGDAQVVLFSAVTDDAIGRLARRVHATGHPVTVVSPDPTDRSTPGRRLAAVERERRLSDLRGAGIRVVDWGDEPLATALDRARRRWSA